MLDAKEVTRICKACLFDDSELIDGKPTVDPVIAEGITRTFGFNPDRLNKFKEQIIELVDMLPGRAMKGVSFLELCMDKNGNQWGEHRNMEELMCLGMAVGAIKCISPKSMWPILPGGVPYYQVVTDVEDDKR